MDILKLYRGEDLLAQLELGDRAIEVGRSAGCDLVLEDRALSPRHYLVAARRGTVVVYDVSAGKRSVAREQHLPYDRPLRVGCEHRLVRSLAGHAALRRSVELSGDTAPLSRAASGSGGLRLVVGHGSDARSYRVGERPLSIGRAEDNDVVLCDSATSARHCRLEPLGYGLLARDLRSRNGTFVNGVQVESALLTKGARLGIGRSALWLVDPESGLEDGLGERLVASSAVMQRVVADVERAAELCWPTLILGESGTGKEALAGLLHHRGPRRKKPLVVVNAGGIPRELIESELFGHERGAFTGATQQHCGVFEQADGGTLFLDEIGELPLSLQARLLRVLESGELRRVGAESTLRVDVRLVCATHRDLRKLVRAGQFRQDLFYRIAQLVIEVPPLRSRPEDVQALSHHFLERMAADVGLRSLSAAARACLLAYAWPGNARELRNVLAAAAAAAPAGELSAADIERALSRVGGAERTAISTEALAQVVAGHGGNLSAAARALGIPRTTLRDRLRASGERREDEPAGSC